MLLLLLPLLLSCEDVPASPGAGVPWDLADRRARTLSDVAYSFDLRIPEDPEAPIAAAATIDVTWTDPDGGALVLDFDSPERRVRAVRVNGRAAGWTPADDHVVVDPSSLRPHARNRVEVEFVTGDGAGLHRDTALVYTLFVPDRGHGTLPLFDQPDLKATVAWTIDAPPGWEVVANGPAMAEASDPGAGSWTFARSRPIATYVMAFAAGRFEVATEVRGGRAFRVLYPGSLGGPRRRVAEEVAEAHARSLAWMEAYTGTDYPFAKFDVVAIPGLRFAGMEHPGVVFYRAEALFPSSDQPVGLGRTRAEIIAHETAHMWFGNLVTMAWFDDAWMKEVLADFMARRIVEGEYPDPEGDLRFLLTYHAGAYVAEQSGAATPIRRPLANLRDADPPGGVVVHRKAPIVLAHLERTLGAEAFRTGIRSFLAAHAWRSASWNDLVDHLGAAHGSDLDVWSQAWVEQPGRPVVRLAWEPGTDGRGAVVLIQERDRQAERLWPQRLTVHGEWSGRTEWTTVEFDDATARVVVWDDVRRPDRVLPNASGLEYGLFQLDEVWTRALVDGLREIRPALLRGTATLLLRDALLEGRVGAAELLDGALSALEVESNELVAAELVDLIGVTYHGHLPDADRTRLASRVGSGLFGRIEHTRAAGLRSGIVEAWRRAVLAGVGPHDMVSRLVSGDDPQPRPEVSREQLTDIAARLVTHGSFEVRSGPMESGTPIGEVPEVHPGVRR
jgi:aminopeptidase N